MLWVFPWIACWFSSSLSERFPQGTWYPWHLCLQIVFFCVQSGNAAHVQPVNRSVPLLGTQASRHRHALGKKKRGISWTFIWLVSSHSKNMNVRLDHHSQDMEKLKSCSKPPTSHCMEKPMFFCKTRTIWSRWSPFHRELTKGRFGMSRCHRAALHPWYWTSLPPEPSGQFDGQTSISHVSRHWNYVFFGPSDQY